jgi:hypothetical protein
MRGYPGKYQTLKVAPASIISSLYFSDKPGRNSPNPGSVIFKAMAAATFLISSSGSFCSKGYRVLVVAIIIFEFNLFPIESTFTISWMESELSQRNMMKASG